MDPCLVTGKPGVLGCSGGSSTALWQPLVASSGEVAAGMRQRGFGAPSDNRGVGPGVMVVSAT